MQRREIPPIKSAGLVRNQPTANSDCQMKGVAISFSSFWLSFWPFSFFVSCSHKFYTFYFPFPINWQICAKSKPTICLYINHIPVENQSRKKIKSKLRRPDPSTPLRCARDDRGGDWGTSLMFRISYCK